MLICRRPLIPGHTLASLPCMVYQGYIVRTLVVIEDSKGLFASLDFGLARAKERQITSLNKLRLVCLPKNFYKRSKGGQKHRQARRKDKCEIGKLLQPIAYLQQCVWSCRQGVTYSLKLAVCEAKHQHAPTEQQENFLSFGYEEGYDL